MLNKRPAASLSQAPTASKRLRTSTQLATLIAAQADDRAITSQPSLPLLRPVTLSTNQPMQPFAFAPALSQYTFHPYIPASSQSQYTPSSISSTLPICLSSVARPTSINQAFSTPAGLNISPMTPCTFRSTPMMPRSQFDSPAFNNTPYRQPSANPYSFGMSAAHPPAVHFPSTPQFQAVQTSRAYSYTPHLSALPYQSPPNFTFTPYNSSGSHRYNTDLHLEMSPIIVPSQYRDNVPTDSPDTRGD
ncbi:hypothetical protein PILCRDRAFT_9891 [Piloderma croceum F 1598]|uniref:Uncharacterized protein n=1 Tax=Piloderma croceum (strain F 1598) TaxID=765440 RepID=A0A0C3B1B2_PILCF|nr:hypothetical protein PILCRDRAFT_9891 [Piloderma croceum F 1598]